VTDPAIIEAAARAMKNSIGDIEHLILQRTDYDAMARSVVRDITPLIEAAALERAAKVAEEYHTAKGAAAAIRALKQEASE
jgi:hypothetical protein